MTSKHDPAMVEKVALAIYEAEPVTEYADDEKPFIVAWSEIADKWTGYPATYESMIMLSTAALTALDLPARDAAMLTQGRREGMEMAAGVCDVAGEMWSRAMAALKGDGVIRTVHVEAAQALAAAIRAKIEDVKS